MCDILVIVNPIAGRGAGARLSSQVNCCLRDHGLEIEMQMTDAPGHATSLARKAAEQGKKTVVAVGGDGTVNEVINGLMQSGGKPALGILPIGTGNDFAFGAGVPLDLQAACRAVSRNQSRVLDLGWVRADNEEARYFGNGVGIGFDAIANIESHKLKWLRGMLVYLVAVLKTLAIYYDTPQTTILVDGQQICQPCLMISIMLGRRLGGGFYITPDSMMDDGLFDLCIAPKIPRHEMVAFVPRFMRGTHVTDPRLILDRGQRVTVVSESPWAAHVDGEIYGVGAQRYEMKLLPRRLRLIC